LGFKRISENEADAFNSFISNSIILDLEEEVIIETIKLRKKYNIKLPDAIIAATCIVNDCSLITNNIKDFEQIIELRSVKAEKRP